MTLALLNASDGANHLAVRSAARTRNGRSTWLARSLGPADERCRCFRHRLMITDGPHTTGVLTTLEHGVCTPTPGLVLERADTAQRLAVGTSQEVQLILLPPISTTRIFHVARDGDPGELVALFLQFLVGHLVFALAVSALMYTLFSDWHT